MMRNTPRLLLILLMLIGLTAGRAAAQDQPDLLADASTAEPATNSPLGVRQDHVRRMVQEMEDRFVKLAKALEPTEPEHAQRILETLKAGKRALLEPRMAKVTELLNAGQLEQAQAEQQKLVADVDKLIDLLTSTADARQREIDQLQQFQRDIAKLIDQQKDLQKQTDIAQNRDKALKTLDQQIAALRDLIEAQKKLKDQTDAARAAGAPAVMKLADDQAKLRRQTQALGKQIDQGPAGSRKGEDGDGDSQQPSAAGSMSKATAHQQQAEQHMGGGQGVSAGSEQGKALDEMNKQLEKLQQQRSNIVRLPPDALPKLSDPQDKLGDKTGDLGSQMQAAGEQNSDGQQGNGTPGQSQVQQAQQQMRQASGQMQQQDGDQAQDHQDKAIAALKDAQKQIEERLRQLRKQTQEETLAALESRFREMLARQKPVTQATADVEASRQSRPAAPRTDDPTDKHPLTRPEKLQVAQLAAEENVLVEMAAKAMDIIREDGTTVVLPEIVTQLHQDLQTTAKFVAAEQTGPYTQALQQEIEKTLEELIDALKKAQEQQQSQGGGQQADAQQPKPQPLVPGSAELKLLRAAQLRINRRTQLFDTERPDVQQLPPDLIDEVNRLSQRQEDVRKMTERLAERR